MVSLNFASWNQLEGWLRRLAALRSAGASTSTVERNTSMAWRCLPSGLGRLP